MNKHPYATLNGIDTPAYVIDEKAMIHNLEILKNIQERTHCNVFLAQKAFSIYQLYDVIKLYLYGVTASGLNEALLGYEYGDGMKIMTYSPAYKEDEFKAIYQISDIVIFNSLSQMNKYKSILTDDSKKIGIRINPEISTQNGSFCNPCTPGSRFGITIEEFKKHQKFFNCNLSGIMFHTMSKQELPDLIKTVTTIERNMESYLYGMDWISFGGGQHITKSGYDIDGLCDYINDFQDKYEIKVLLEPGEAVMYGAGMMVSKILDIVQTDKVRTAVIDCSAFAHMPDILALNEKPKIYGASHDWLSGTNKYMLGANSCLSGDVIGEYFFHDKLRVNDRVIIMNQAIYTIVCNNWFNGMSLPDIGILHSDGEYEVIRSFGYQDYKGNL